MRVYDWNGSAWTKLGADIDGEAAGDRSGVSVSLSSDGTRVAIGANLNAATVTTQATCGSMTTMAMLGLKSVADIDGEAADDQSGFSVSLSSDGTRVAIGALANDGNGSDSGHVRVYEYSGGAWAQLGTDIDGEAADDQSGFSVSLSSDGTRVAIGALANDGNGSNSGHVRVYEYSGSAWAQVGDDIDGEAAGDLLGLLCLPVQRWHAGGDWGACKRRQR